MIECEIDALWLVIFWRHGQANSTQGAGADVADGTAERQRSPDERGRDDADETLAQAKQMKNLPQVRRSYKLAKSLRSDQGGGPKERHQGERGGEREEDRRNFFCCLCVVE